MRCASCDMRCRFAIGAARRAVDDAAERLRVAVDLAGAEVDRVGTTLRERHGTDTFTYTISDTAGVVTDADAATATVTVNVTAVNDPPVLQVPGPQVIDEDSSLIFSADNGNLITLSDVDASSAAMMLRHGLHEARPDAQWRRLSLVKGAGEEA